VKGFKRHVPAQAKNKSFKEILGFLERSFDEILHSPSVLMQLNKGHIIDIQITHLFLNEFLAGRAQVYKIAREFGMHLHDTKLDIPVSVVPDIFRSYLFEFPLAFRGSSGERYTGAIVHLGKNVDGRKAIMMNSMEDKPDEGYPTTHFCLNLKTDGTISDSLKEFDATVKDKQRYMPDAMIHYVIKCILYVESGEPDLKKEGHLSTSKKKRKVFSINELPYPVVLVGYSFHNRTYHVDQFKRSGHFRWQPYGEGRTKVKLIWIDEQIINRKVTANNEVSHGS